MSAGASPSCAPSLLYSLYPYPLPSSCTCATTTALVLLQSCQAAVFLILLIFSAHASTLPPHTSTFFLHYILLYLPLFRKHIARHLGTSHPPAAAACMALKIGFYLSPLRSAGRLPALPLSLLSINSHTCIFVAASPRCIRKPITPADAQGTLPGGASLATRSLSPRTSPHQAILQNTTPQHSSPNLLHTTFSRSTT